MSRLESDNRQHKVQEKLYAVSRDDKVLISDVDPEIKISYWKSVDEVFQNMGKNNPVFNLPRGWLFIRKRDK